MFDPRDYDGVTNESIERDRIRAIEAEEEREIAELHALAMRDDELDRMYMAARGRDEHAVEMRVEMAAAGIRVNVGRRAA